ncbi:MAG TPA: hypothetical protein VGM59_05770 [Dongiaceae bacterium]|jgi:hypothetical protein
MRLQWIPPAIFGALFGAGAAIGIGFWQGGWYSAASADRFAQVKSDAAVVDALVPVCVNQSKLDPDLAAKIAQMKLMVTDYERRDFVMNAGWATMPAAMHPDRDLATACADALIKPGQAKSVQG